MGEMELDLFDYEGWESMDVDGWYVAPVAEMYYRCALKVPIGKFEEGDMVPSIAVDFEKRTLKLFDKDQTLISEHRIQLTVVD